MTISPRAKSNGFGRIPVATPGGSVVCLDVIFVHDKQCQRSDLMPNKFMRERLPCHRRCGWWFDGGPRVPLEDVDHILTETESKTVKGRCGDFGYTVERRTPKKET